MKATIVSVKGHEFQVYSDFNLRATLAINELGEKKILRSSGYISSPATIKKTIKLVFGL